MDFSLLIDSLVSLLGADAVQCELSKPNVGVRQAGKQFCDISPTNTAQVASAIRLLRREGIDLAMQSMNAASSTSVFTISVSRMHRILSIDTRNRLCAVEAGVTIAALRAALAGEHLCSALCQDDQDNLLLGDAISDCTGICNADSGAPGGILSLTAVMPDGEIVQFGDAAEACGGYDLASLFRGSGSTLGIITEATLRLFASPSIGQSIFDEDNRIGISEYCCGAESTTPDTQKLMEGIRGVFSGGDPDRL